MEKQIIEATILLREKQREFFKTHSQTVLQDCKRVERELDAMLAKYQQAHTEGRITEQGSLL